eukprot:scaffold58745_cov66-Phaeocystis_antarctica.AAC.1
MSLLLAWWGRALVELRQGGSAHGHGANLGLGLGFRLGLGLGLGCFPGAWFCSQSGRSNQCTHASTPSSPALKPMLQPTHSCSHIGWMVLSAASTGCVSHASPSDSVCAVQSRGQG